jgi:hypothetical protein
MVGQSLRRVLRATAFVAPLVGVGSGIAGAPTQSAKFSAADAKTSDWFARSVAYSGDTALVGAPYADYYRGAAYVFVRMGTTWTQQAKFTDPDVQIADEFGFSVAIDGDTAVVGQFVDQSFSIADLDGAAFVYARTNDTWTPQAKLMSPTPSFGDHFGRSVALAGDTVVVGAWGDDAKPGAAYVFVRTGTDWTQQAKLTADDGAAADRFGLSVAIEGDTVAVGANGADGGRGAVYVFARSGPTWTQEAKLTSSDLSIYDGLGATVAVAGDTLLAGESVPFEAAVFVFTRTGTTWSQQAKLEPADSAVADFGVSIALRGDTAVVGMSYVQGAAYVFRRSGATWTQRAKVTTADEMPDDFYPYGYSFGVGVAAADETRVVIGAPPVAAVYAFDLPAGAGPPQGYCLATKVRARFDAEHPEKSALVVSGTLETGPGWPDFYGPATFDLGGIHLDVPEFVEQGDALTYGSDGFALTVAPAKYRGSRATFRVKAVGDLAGKVARDGPLTLRFKNTTHDLNGTVRLAAGALAPRGVVAPDLAVLGAVVAYRSSTTGPHERGMRLTLGFASDGVVPATAEDLTVSIGGAFAEALRDGWGRRGGAWVRRAKGPGITRATIDYVRGTITIVGSRLGLGWIDGPVAVTITRGSDVRTATVRMVRRETRLSY